MAQSQWVQRIILQILCGMGIVLNGERRESLDDCLVGESPVVHLIYPGSAPFAGIAVGTNLRYDYLPCPRIIVNVTSVADVQASVKCGVEFGVSVTVMGGGHSFEAASSSLSASGLLLHMDFFNEIKFDPTKTVVTVQAGTRLGRLYGSVALLEQQELGRTYLVGGGTCPTVGVAGHVLCGGYGYLGRFLGLTSDQVVSFQVVTAPQGTLMNASDSENPHLFWSLRGGCSTAFGIVASVTLRITSLPSTPLTVINLPRVPFTDPRLYGMLAWWQVYASGASPREFTSTATFSTSGVDIAAVFVGSVAQAQAAGVMSAVVQGMQGIVSLEQVLAASTEGSFLDAVLWWSSMAPTKAAEDLVAITSLESLERRRESTISRRKAKSHLPLSPLSADDISHIHALFVNGTINQMEWKAYGVSGTGAGAGANLYTSKAYTDARSPLWRGHLFEMHWGASRATNLSEPEPERRARDAAMVAAVNAAAERMNAAAKSARAYVGYIDFDLASPAASYYGLDNAARLREARGQFDPSGLLSGPVDQYLYGGGDREEAEEVLHMG